VPALALVAAITAARLALLAFNRTDLFVDESQYWLWGQSLDWGYYSKPPLIAWVIRAVTDLAGSDAAFWVRAPGAVLHGVTALLLAGVAARIAGGQAAAWTAAGYVTLPAVAVGSLLFSTDTVMAPLLAGAILLWLRVLDGRSVLLAAACGALLGLAMLAKYAGVYGLLGMVLAGLAVRGGWPGWRPVLAMGAAAAAVLSPNIVWNLSNDLTTLSHTADNIGWLAPGAAGPGFSFASLLTFAASQAAVAGPVVAVGFIVALSRLEGPATRVLAVLAVLPLAVVSVQALLDEANANWAFAGWLPGVVLAFVWLSARPRLAALAMAINAAVCLALPVLTVMPEVRIAGRLPLERYIGRAEVSRAALAEAQAAGAAAVVSPRRDVLADLLYTGRDAGVPVYAEPHAGRARHYYDQRFPLPAGLAGQVLLVGNAAPACPSVRERPLPLAGGAYESETLSAWLVDAGCLRARP
jgi:4-amino-4-deoxy-L-arabinose transferase-like glycosyltransferase